MVRFFVLLWILLPASAQYYIASTVAGSGRGSIAADSPALSAPLVSPRHLAVDAANNIYVTDSYYNQVLRVTPSGTISVFAGEFNNPAGLAFDRAGNLLVADTGNNRIRRITPAGAASTFASLTGPEYLAFDANGSLLVSQTAQHTIRRIAADGTATLFAGTGDAGFLGDNAAATAARLNAPAGLRFDSRGNLVFADSGNHRIRRVAPNGIITTIAGTGETTVLNRPADLTINAADLVFIADTGNHRLRGLSAEGAFGVIAGDLLGLTGLAFDNNGSLLLALTQARQIRRINNQGTALVAGAGLVTSDNTILPNTLLDPTAVAADTAGNLYLADAADHRIRRINTAGVPTTQFGNGLPTFIGAPQAIHFDRFGNTFISNGVNSTVQRISAGGVLSVAAEAAQVRNPVGVTSDTQGNVYVADSANHRVRRIDGATQALSVFAGTGVAGLAGDGGAALNAQLNHPRHVATDRGGNLYMADTGNNRIRVVNAAGVISTFAELPAPQGLAIDDAGNLFAASNHRVFRFDTNTKLGVPIAGTGVAGFSGDGALATNANFDTPQGLTVDRSGNVFVVDQRNFRLRRLSPVSIVNEGVAHAATGRAGAVAPGLIISIFGYDLGPTPAEGIVLDANGRVSTEVSGTRVLFDNIAAPLLYVSANQVNAVVPYGVTPGASTRLQVIFRGRATNTLSLPVAATSPGVFAIVNEDGTVNSASNPARAGSVVILYGSGEGQTSPAGVDGSVATEVFPQPVLPVSIQVGGRSAAVLYAGAAPGFVAGVFQMNLRVPDGLTGAQALKAQVGAGATPDGITVHMR
jgi:uncharacterized protein (TIGR03437 family)